MMRGTVLACILACAAAVDWDVTTPLDEYVNAPDPNFAFTELTSYRYTGEGFTMHVLNLTSQRWMDESVSESPIWWHYLAIAIPTNVRFNDAAYINIGAGMNDEDEEVPTPENDSNMRILGNFSRNTGAVAAYLKQNPNQPIYMTDEPIWRVEDFIIGYTWRKFIEDDAHPNIVLQLPMTKAAKVAMDAVVQFTNAQNPNINITRYMPSGYSKRGWVSWLLAAVDRRVFATCPVVFDLLNFRENLHHHFRSLGGWSWAFSPYWLEDCPQYIDHPRTSMLGSFIDPLAFNERLTMPKLVILASGDQFFLPDDSHYFWDDLTPPKNILLIEDTDHSMGGKRDVVERNREAFFLASLTGWKYPTQTWQRNETATSGSISLSTDTTPRRIRAWMGDSNNTIYDPPIRDFRDAAVVDDNMIDWQEYSVRSEGNNQYYIEFAKRQDPGWRSFFISVLYDGPEGRTIDITSELNIIPDTMPYPRCTTREECHGEIV